MILRGKLFHNYKKIEPYESLLLMIQKGNCIDFKRSSKDELPLHPPCYDLHHRR
jgi:hypothetical protein